MHNYASVAMNILQLNEHRSNANRMQVGKTELQLQHTNDLTCNNCKEAGRKEQRHIMWINKSVSIIWKCNANIFLVFLLYLMHRMWSSTNGANHKSKCSQMFCFGLFFSLSEIQKKKEKETTMCVCVCVRLVAGCWAVYVW